MKTVCTTTDYTQFRQIDGNRSLNKMHLNRIKTSMAERYLFSPIIVNERFEIIDGQHRYLAAKDLELPLHYIVCDGYGLNEVHRLNQVSKTWSCEDYLAGYSELGYPDYIKYKEYKSKYKFGHNECMALLTNMSHKSTVQPFYAGQFKIRDYDSAIAMTEKIVAIEPYYRGIRRRAFVYAFLRLMKNPNFAYSEFMQKLESQPTALVDCATAEQFISLIEEIYNYRRRVKINLRY